MAVTGDRHHEPFQLLRVLDSVAALLPFGMRSTLSAASSTSSGSEVPMRLYWGDADGSPGVTGLTLSGELPDLGELSPQARSYHDLLIENWTAHGGDAVVRHLADAREPLDISGPETHARALEVLEALDPSLAVVQAVSEGQEVGADRINQALRTPGISTGALAVLAGKALTDPDTGMEALAPLMSSPVVSQAFRDQLFDDLLHGRTDVARRDFENMSAALTSTGRSLDPLDEVLAGVCTWRPSGARRSSPWTTRTAPWPGRRPHGCRLRSWRRRCRWRSTWWSRTGGHGEMPGGRRRLRRVGGPARRAGGGAAGPGARHGDRRGRRGHGPLPGRRGRRAGPARAPRGAGGVLRTVLRRGRGVRGRLERPASSAGRRGRRVAAELRPRRPDPGHGLLPRWPQRSRRLVRRNLHTLPAAAANSTAVR
ncbi:hypothetical protein [Streptomyces sp. HYC2]|uniref:hypothetical protein n=1 Tax=Streptomyces sp. HYC2 TaxID=2955207 RepID=UPI0024814880|nr:hypothetical protein [Streptomyces sp. HYC2]